MPDRRPADVGTAPRCERTRFIRLVCCGRDDDLSGPDQNTIPRPALRLVYTEAVTLRTPIPTRLDEDEIAALDEAVSAGLASNRSEAIRLSIRRMKDALDRARIGDEIVSGYMTMPQTKEELAAARVSAVALLDAESWSEYESTPSEPS